MVYNEMYCLRYQLIGVPIDRLLIFSVQLNLLPVISAPLLPKCRAGYLAVFSGRS